MQRYICKACGDFPTFLPSPGTVGLLYASLVGAIIMCTHNCLTARHVEKEGMVLFPADKFTDVGTASLSFYQTQCHIKVLILCTSHILYKSTHIFCYKKVNVRL